jgi:hypothetical protein
VLVERNYELIATLSDKVKTYKFFSALGYGLIPPYAVATTVDEFATAYARLKNISNRCCLKFTSDEGAASFRVIDDDAVEAEYLTRRSGARITYDQAVRGLRCLQPFRPLLVMPYLPGLEVSVDCLYRKEGEHIIIPRFKSQGRSETIRYDAEIVKTCNDFLHRTEYRITMSLQCAIQV